MSVMDHDSDGPFMLSRATVTAERADLRFHGWDTPTASSPTPVLVVHILKPAFDASILTPFFDAELEVGTGPNCVDLHGGSNATHLHGEHVSVEWAGYELDEYVSLVRHFSERSSYYSSQWHAERSKIAKAKALIQELKRRAELKAPLQSGQHEAIRVLDRLLSALE